MAETNWTPGLVVLAVGLVFGLVFALRFRGKAPAPEADADARDLRAKRDALIAQLKELEATAEKLTPEVLRVRRAELELAAATAWRDLDRAEQVRAPAPASDAPAPAPAAAQAGFFARHGALTFTIGIVGAGLFGFFLNNLLNANTASRAQGMTATGNAPSGGAPMGAGMGAAEPEPEADDEEVAELRALVAQHPESAEAKLDLAQALVFRDRLVEAFELSQAVLATEADNPRALTYTAIVRLAMGQGEVALGLLDRAVGKDPAQVEAWVHRGLVAYQLEKYDVAVKSWETALELRPDGRSAIGKILEDAKKRATGWRPEPKPGPAMSAAAPAAPRGGGAPSAQAVSGTIELDPAAAAKVGPGSVLFVVARASGAQGGPPAAVKRLPAAGFPLTFSLGPEDAMIQGLPWPEKTTVEARIDADGVATTKDPADPAARAEDLAPGQKGVRLVLRSP